MTAWSHLPNAVLIDRVLADLITYHSQFGAEGLESHYESHCDSWYTAWCVAFDAASDASCDTARDAVLDAVWQTIGDTADGLTWNAAREETTHVIREIAGNAMTALVVYDDADQYLNMTSDQLRFWAVLSHEPAAVLLQPYVRARELIAQLHSQEVMS